MKKYPLGFFRTWRNLLLCGLILFSAKAHAIGGSLGVLMGIGVPSSSSAVFSYGLELAFKPSPALAIGGYYQSYGLGLEVNSSVAQATMSTSNALYGISGVYYFTGTLQYFYGGVRLGLSKVSTSLSATDLATGNVITISNSSSPIIVTPRLGYEVPTGRWAVGGDVSYILGFGDEAPKGFLLLAFGKFVF